VNKNKRDKIVREAQAKVNKRHEEPKPEPAAVVVEVIKAAKPVKVAKAKPEVVTVAVGDATVEMAKLPTMAKMPRVRSRKPKPLRDCACGCGGQTRATWAMGHDARAKGWALRIQRNICTMDDVPVNERQGAKLMLDRLESGDVAAPSIKIVKSDHGDKAVNE
jgi:hypothetical protein